MATNGGSIDIQSGIIAQFLPKITNYSYLCRLFMLLNTIIPNKQHMKKLAFALACIVGMMFFASCDPESMEQLPEVSFVEGEGLISHNIGVRLGTELKFNVSIAPNTGSESELKSMEFFITNADNQRVLEVHPTIENPAGENVFEYTYTPEAVSAYTVTVKVSDQAGKTRTEVLAVGCFENVEAGELGAYRGTMDLHGYVTSNEIAGYDAYQHEEIDVPNVPVTITLGELNGDNVKVGLDVEDTYVAIDGKWNSENNTLTILDIDFYKSVNLFINVSVHFTTNITGVVENDVMTLSGTAEGEGTARVLVAKLDVKFEEGTVNGELQKITD